VRQRVVPPADPQRSLDADHKIVARLPHDPLGVMPLHDQQLFSLHPGVDCLKHIR
jgi:hypothetical protein